MQTMQFRISFLFLALFTFLATLISAEAHAFKKPKEAPKPIRRETAAIDTPSWYGALSGSVNFVTDSTLHEVRGTGLSGTVTFDNDYGVALAVGRSLGIHTSMLSNVRLELEQSHRVSNAAKFIPNTGTAVTLDDETTMQTTMVNGYADFDSGAPWKPYLGLGLGIGRMSVSSNALNIDDTQTVFAYQGLAGMTYQPTSMRNAGIVFGYRYLGAVDPTFASSIGSDIDLEYAAHILELGARLRF